MRIAEISPNDLRRDRPPSPPATLHHQQEQLLSQIESIIKQIEAKASTPNDAASLSSSTLSSDLSQTLARLSQLLPLTNLLKLQLWKLSYRLWNSCVDIANAASLLSASSSGAASLHISLRHSSAEILALVVDVSGVPSPLIKAASFYLKTGLIYHDDLKEFDLASSCFEKATDMVSKIDNVEKISDPGETKLLLELNLARSRTAWELADRNLAVTLLNRSKGNLLFGSPDHYKLIASQYLEFGKTLLSLKKEDGVCNLHNEALKLIKETLDLCEKGLGFSRTKEQTMELKGLRSKALRFLSAVHLQKGEFESVIKCVRVLREDGSLGEGGNQHASLPVLAMKAWLGLGRYVEAEKELRGMVVNKGVPEGVWVGAVEEYFESAGTTGAETAKGVFLGLYGRCHVSAGSAVRVARRVIAGRGSGRGDGGEGSRVRAKVVAELVSDERVLGLFEQANAGKERNAMHAVLWDCASDHFKLKDYSTSAEMFEKSLLYVPHNIENRNLRAKGFRVLCLCHLAMSQLDRALEYISEAEKLEPNICCAFLKYKIFLQNKEHDDAVNQIQAMRDCLDFSPDFLLLSAHEAVACQAFTVAAAALSSLLSFYTPGKPMPITEVVVLRTLITMLSKDPGNEMGVLKFMKLAHSRALELGTENFYGKEEEGRREQNWFAVTSWNFGTRCGKEKKYELCADFFRLASDLFGGLADGDQHQNVLMVCKSLILAACSMMALENQKKELLSETELKHTVELLDKADKILTSFSVGTQIWDNRLTTLEPQLLVMYTFVAYDIHGRIDNFGSRQQLVLVKNFASSKACNSKYLLQLGLTACQGPRSNLEVATFALNESLSALLSSSSPDYQDVALILRRLIAVASIHKGDSDDEAVHDMYKQAYRIMVGLQEGEYPAEEGKWLAMTAWNRAAVPVRTGQIELAVKWMNIGLEIATKVVGMETYRACMEDSITALGKTVAQKNGSSIAATST